MQKPLHWNKLITITVLKMTLPWYSRKLPSSVISSCSTLCKTILIVHCSPQAFYTNLPFHSQKTPPPPTFLKRVHQTWIPASISSDLPTPHTPWDHPASALILAASCFTPRRGAALPSAHLCAKAHPNALPRGSYPQTNFTFANI